MNRAHPILGLLVATFSLAACSEEPSTGKANADAPLVEPSGQLAKLSGFAGTYVIVDARRSAEVAAPALTDQTMPIGETITFTQTGIQLAGADCDDWRIKPTENAVLFVASDPGLVDLVLGPTDSPGTRGDQQSHLGFEMLCEGEHFGLLHKVDDRILVMPWANSAINLILERTLTPVQIKAYQMQLKSMKFYDGSLNGELDEETLRASRAWYAYRANLDESQPIPARPAISENLLDALGVLSSQ